jgi:hypothetical protein
VLVERLQVDRDSNQAVMVLILFLALLHQRVEAVEVLVQMALKLVEMVVLVAVLDI